MTMADFSTSPTLALSPGSDTGVSHADGITNDTTPVITGTAAPNATVTLLDNGVTVVGTTRADKLGNYVLTSTALVAGLHTLTAETTNAAGQVTETSAPLYINLHTQATGTVTTPLLPAGVGNLTFSVHFNQPVGPVTATSFAVLTTGSAFGNVEQVTGSGQDYSVTVAGIGGAGTIALKAGTTPVTDLAGNTVALSEANSHGVADTTSPVQTLVSSSTTGVAVPGGDGQPSASGRLVAFLSDDGTLVANGPAGVSNVYVKDMQTGTILLVTNGIKGPADDNTLQVEISDDGTTIAFSSLATNLIPGGTPASQLNLYVAHLASTPGTGALQLVPGSLSLIAPLAVGEDFDNFVLSGNGQFVAFTAVDTLTGGSTGANSVYLKNLTTGSLTDVTASTPSLDDEASSISGDGTEIAYDGFGNDGVKPQGTEPSEHVYAYSTTTGQTTVIDAYGVFDGQDNVVDRSPNIEDGSNYDTYSPVLSRDGKVVTYLVQSDVGKGDNYSEFRSVLPSTTPEPVSSGAAVGGGTDQDSSASSNQDGSLIAYEATTAASLVGILYSASTNSSTLLGPMDGLLLSAQGNVVVADDLLAAGNPEQAVYETSTGVSASVSPIDGNDAVNAANLSQAEASGLAVSGTTNAPAGAAVNVVLYNAAGSQLAIVSGIADGAGHWTASLPIAALMQPDGVFSLGVQIIEPNGASAITSRQFTLDTIAPTTPGAVMLDVGSDTGPAHSGMVTNQSLPTLTGTTEPFATVKLYDADSTTPDVPIGTATADQNGVYAISLGAPADSAANQTVPIPAPLAPTVAPAPGSISGMSPALFYALLSLDAYDRGYGAGLDVAALGGPFATTLGDATIGRSSTDVLGLNTTSAVGFFALTYQVGGKTVISYRGTDDASLADKANDIVNGWITGTGAVSTQANLALQFYLDLQGNPTLADAANPNMVLTGHSLGGGLAGYVGSIIGETAYGYDNEPYSWAAVRFVAQYNSAHPSAPVPLPSGSGFTLIHVSGEVLEAIRGDSATFAITELNALESLVDPAVSMADVAQAINIPGQQNNLPALVSDNPVGTNISTENHSIALLIVLQYASDNKLTAWMDGGVGKDLFAAYFNNQIGAALGVAAVAGAANPAAKLLDMIAYSVIPEGVMPYGDTGATALFAGGDALGTLYSEPTIIPTLAPASVEMDLAQIDVAYSGWLALNQDENANHESGQIAYDATNHSLTVDLSAVYWQVLNATTQLTAIASAPALLGWVDFLNNVDQGVLSSGIAATVQRVIIGTASGATLEAPNQPGTTLIVAADGGSTVTGSNGDDLIISSDSGNSVIDGGAGSDTVYYAGSVGSFGLSMNADGSFSVAKPSGGVDTLVNVEFIALAGGQRYGLTAQGPVLGLVDGLHDLTVTAADAAGNVSAVSDPLTLTVESVPPAPPVAALTATSDSGTSNSDGITDDATPTIGGTAEANSLVTLYDGLNGPILGKVTTGGDGTFSITSSDLLDGLHALQLTATDAAGNISAASSTVFVRVMTTTPAAPKIGSFEANGAEFGYDVAGTAAPDSIVALYADSSQTALDTTTAGDDGNYIFVVSSLTDGPHALTATSTDAAGNVSPASAPIAVIVDDSVLVPPGTPIVNGTVTDGPIAGATVFADANGNGVQDTGEATAVTQSDGTFGLFGGSGELIATGGIDSSTGLTPPGALTAPAGSTVITPLTTLLDAYAAALGVAAASVQAQLATALGLQAGGSTDLMELDPVAAVLSGSSALDPAIAGGAAQIVSAKLMDIAVDFTAGISGLGLTQSKPVIFAEVFDAIAQAVISLPAGGTLDLDSASSLQSLMTAVLAELSDPQDHLPFGADAAAEVASSGATQLDTAAASSGATLLADVAQIEAVVQGTAATALATVGNNQALYGVVLAQFTGPALADASSLALDLTEGAPQLAPGSDTGSSDRDGVIDIDTPTFIGTANPGTYVTLFLLEDTTRVGLVIGEGVADSTGHYSIVSAPLDQPSQSGPYSQWGIVGAIGSTNDPGLAVGGTVSLPSSYGSTYVTFDLPVSNPLLEQPNIAYATVAAAPGDISTQSALFLQVSVGEYGHGEIAVFADGGTTPVATTSFGQDTGFVTLTTTPLSLGTHALTVTETEVGGTQIESPTPISVNVTAATLLAGTGMVLGGLAGALIENAPVSALTEASLDPIDGTTTSGDGGYVAQPDPDYPLKLVGGYDTVTGEPLGGYLARNANSNYGFMAGGVTGRLPTLLAPYDATTINPLTTIQALLDDDDDNPGGGADPDDNQSNAEATLAAFGLSTSYNLATLDPLALAETGDPAPLLATIKLIDTVTMLSPFFNTFNFGLIAGYLEDGSGTIDLDSVDDIEAAMNRPDDQYAVIAAAITAITAASNEAIDAHAAASTSVADTVSYALAASEVAQETETALLQQALRALDDDPSQLPALDTAYSGAALDDTILAERAQLTQATGFVPVGAGTTSASSVVFTIDFSQPVTGVTRANFTAVTGGDLAGVNVTEVTAVAGSNGASYDVSVDTGIGQGSLAVAFSGTGLTGAGDEAVTAGSFAPPTFYASPDGYNLTGLAVGDFNGDGRPDVVATEDGYFVLYLNENGSLVAEPSDSVGFDPADPIAVGDFNGDGKLDVVTLGGAGELMVREGDGAGGFGQPTETVVSGGSQMTVGDFNGDGLSDVAVSSDSGNTVSVELGNGDGSFRTDQTLTTGSVPAAIGNADLNHDGHLDLVTTNANDGTVSVFLGAGGGTFAASGSPIAAGSDPDGLAIGDLNGDGIPDIAVTDGGQAVAHQLVTILLGKGDGTFTTLAPLTLSSEQDSQTSNFYASSIAMGDVNNDGRADLVVGSSATGTIVLLGNGDGTFRFGEQNSTGGSDIYAPSLALADVNSDGRLDILSAGQGTSTLQTAEENRTIGYDYSGYGLEVADNIAEPVLGSTSSSVTIARAAVAQPVLSEASGGGTLTHVGNDYTLDLGTVATAGTLAFSLANAATGNADSFDGEFSPATGSGFTITGATLPAAVAAGASYAGLTFTIDTSTTGTHTETITFAPRDATAVASADTAPDASTGDVAAVTPAASSVGLELAPITLTVTDNVEAGTAPATPTIAGTVAGQADSDEAGIKPFVSVAIADANADQTETVTVTPDAAGNGALSDPSATSDGGTVSGDVYTMSGSAAQVTTALQNLVFTPTAHQVTPGSAVTTGFTIAVSDTAGQTTSDATTSVIATAVEDPPLIAGTRSGQAITDQQTVQPFAQATITDPDAGAAETTTITLSASGAATDTAGTLSGTGLTHTGTGTYLLLAASPSGEQSLLQAIVFTPATGTAGAGSSVTTGFGVQVSDGADTASDQTTSVITTQAASGQPVPVTVRLADDTGLSATDLITRDDALIGGAAAGSTVTFTDNGAVLGTALADGSGAYSFTPTGLADGADMVAASDDGSTATLSFTLDTSAPTVTQPVLTVAGNAAATPVGIQASDTLSTGDQLSATIVALPTDGSVTLDGNAVQAGQVLTADQLTQLEFIPTAGVSNVTSTLGFAVTDAAGNSTTSAATLAVGALTGGGSGDVHMITFDGLYYDFQATGEFVVAKASVDGTDDGFAVQMRAIEWNQNPGTSIATEIGAHVGQSVVRFGIDGTPVTVDGASVPGLGSTSDTLQLSDGVLSRTGDTSWLLSWNSGESLSVTDTGHCLNFAVTVGPHDAPGSLEGLLGQDTGQANDFQLSDGTVLPQPLSPSMILGQFADTWRVAAGSSLLDAPLAASATGSTTSVAPVASLAGQSSGQMSFLYPASVTIADIKGAIWAGSLGGSGPVEIVGQSGMLASGSLANLALGDLIDLTDLDAATSKASYGAGVLQVSDGSHLVSIPIAGAMPGSAVSVTADPHGGLLVHLT